MQLVSCARLMQISWNAIVSERCRIVIFFNCTCTITHVLYLWFIYLMEIAQSDKQLKTSYQIYPYYINFNHLNQIQVESTSCREGTHVTRKQGCRDATIKDQTSFNLTFRNNLLANLKGGSAPNVYA
ncbi:Hypothetical_protein [Hexamita inflata]|uniref:Hypothetical_protein n=1 Tax=Hexamita inflata TaxID=28002 RepID=A0AA86R6J3_9EUKA|nr:Hypothetical protein HINF_LOCUS33690 [Hexamita inflata]CAI9946049.1 Hypothetical protein HINF_LOCUS33694 [Hexamita inflata]CAI9968136.1 Hypothetical protein HINF_LOCUS55781 [Hexamita inflata]